MRILVGDDATLGVAPAVAAVLLAAAVAAGPTASPDTGNPLTELVGAAARRLEIAGPVAAFKWGTGAPVEDPDRVSRQLAALGAAAAAEGIDSGYVTAVFADQIHATEAVEYTLFAAWKLNPADAPTAAPDLSASRAAIDTLNQVMLIQIAQQWQLLHSPECAARLDAARREVGEERGLDGFSRHALASATRSYCR